jgi:hypothetical protein
MWEDYGDACMREIGGKRSLGRPRGRWVAIIGMDLEEIGWGGMN